MMPNPTEKINTTLDFLIYELGWGFLYYYTAQTIVYESRENEKLLDNKLFFSALFASTDDAILILSRLVIPNKNSIIVDYLLNLIENNCDLLPINSKTKVLSAVRKHRIQLGDMKPFIKKIKRERDKKLANADRVQVNNPENNLSNPTFYMEEVGNFLHDLVDIVNTYNKFLSRSIVDMSNLIEETQLDVNSVLSNFLDSQNSKSS